MLRALIARSLLAGLFLSVAPAFGWGDVGHEVIALIAYRHLTPAARATLDGLLSQDDDSLTAPDVASRATWADRYRNAHRETAPWHFVDIELDAPDVGTACFGFPPLAHGEPASAGPRRDCVVNKLDEFVAELKDPATPAPERLLALKFVLHFAGDMHQPLHAADHHDRGANCIRIASPRLTNLHAYWDVDTVTQLGGSPRAIADSLDRQITPELMHTWTQGSTRSWALEAHELARRDAYALPDLPGCRARRTVGLSPAYRERALEDTALQLKRAGVRLAAILNGALGPQTRASRP